MGKPPYGYRNGRDGPLEVLREEAAVVELIYRLYTKDGLGLRLIARHLNELGLPTRRGGRWNMVTLRDILRNPTYTGTSTRFGLRVPKSHEPIIPADVFRAVQDRTVARRPSVSRSGAEPFVLSGMAYCGYCGNKMMGVTRRQTWKRKDGHRARGVYRYYQCQSRNNQSICGYHTWRAPLLEEEVLSQLRLALKARADRLEGDISSTREREIQAIWAARVANAEHRFVRAMRRAAKGELGIAELGHYLDQIDIVRRQASSPRTDADGSKTLSAWDSLPVPERQSFLMGHVARIVVRDDEVEVVV